MSSAITRGLVAAAIAGGIALFSGMPLMAPIAIMLIGGAAWAREAQKKSKRTVDEAKETKPADGVTPPRDALLQQTSVQIAQAASAGVVANGVEALGDSGAPRRSATLPDASPVGPGRSG